MLEDIFGNSQRIKILEELVSNWDIFLSADEMSRMSDISKNIVNVHINDLNKTGLLVFDGDKFKLNPHDSRSIAIALIECDEYLRKSAKFENNLKATV